ncbi:MAG TPA: hypothetical protein VLA62_03215 [Solirubrobacterales bacterium]|nr:hypothetical protein [Solirubrobacterales bacterium]
MRPVLASLLILAAACGSSDVTGPSRRVALGQSFELRVGEAAMVADELLVIGFTGVTSDSRCPIDVVCVWAGDATLRLTLRRLPNAAEVVEVKTPGTPEASYRGYTIEVPMLLPAPRAAAPTDTGAYVATLIVRRAAP